MVEIVVKARKGKEIQQQMTWHYGTLNGCHWLQPHRVFQVDDVSAREPENLILKMEKKRLTIF